MGGKKLGADGVEGVAEDDNAEDSPSS